MALSLYDIERGIGLDLMRRPVITAFLNAFLLRLFADVFFYSDDDEEDDDDDDSSDGNHDKEDYKQWVQQKCVERGLPEKGAVLAVVVLVQLLRVVGVFETLMWIVIALLFSALRLPRVYAFEKLLLDVVLLIYRPSVRYVKKSIHLQCESTESAPRFHASHHGFGVFVITIITSDSLARDSSALLKLMRYVNYTSVTYWSDNAVVIVGANTHIERALCTLCKQTQHVDLGWHRDVFERTNFRLEVVFSDDSFSGAATKIQTVGKKVVLVELCAALNARNVELLVKTMAQFAAVCEAYERGLRLFNGKRMSIYAVGLSVSVLLIIYYEGLPGLVKPSADVLTLAVGAFTLWMTVGKSAALGDTQEETSLSVGSRDNLLLAYHGLARIEASVRNISWVPEVFREAHDAQTGEQAASAAPQDGSLSVLEAAVCVSIFEHRGHFVRWCGPRLRLFRLRVGAAESDGVATVLHVERVRSLSRLEAPGGKRDAAQHEADGHGHGHGDGDGDGDGAVASRVLRLG